MSLDSNWILKTAGVDNLKDGKDYHVAWKVGARNGVGLGKYSSIKKAFVSQSGSSYLLEHVAAVKEANNEVWKEFPLYAKGVDAALEEIRKVHPEVVFDKGGMEVCRRIYREYQKFGLSYSPEIVLDIINEFAGVDLNINSNFVQSVVNDLKSGKTGVLESALLNAAGQFANDKLKGGATRELMTGSGDATSDSEGDTRTVFDKVEGGSLEEPSVLGETNKNNDMMSSMIKDFVSFMEYLISSASPKQKEILDRIKRSVVFDVINYAQGEIEEFTDEKGNLQTRKKKTPNFYKTDGVNPAQKQNDTKKKLELFNLFFREYPEYKEFKAAIDSHIKQVGILDEFRGAYDTFWKSIDIKDREAIKERKQTITTLINEIRDLRIKDVTSAEHCLSLLSKIESIKASNADTMESLASPEAKERLNKAIEGMKNIPNGRNILSAELYTSSGNLAGDRTLEDGKANRELLRTKAQAAHRLLDSQEKIQSSWRDVTPKSASLKDGQEYHVAWKVGSRNGVAKGIYSEIKRAFVSTEGSNYQLEHVSAVKEASNTLTPKICSQIGKILTNEGMDGNGRLTVSMALSKINQTLELFGYSIPMQTGDSFLGVSGNKLIPILGPDGEEEARHGIAFSWYRYNELATDDVCEIVAYVS